jgi:hypothetical protein
MQLLSSEDAMRDDPRSTATTGVAPEISAEDLHPETSEAFSATQSEVESMVKHHHRKASLQHSAFFDQEFNALS